MPTKLSIVDALRTFGVVLRVPALFLLDTWYKTDPIALHAQWSQFYWKESQQAFGGHAQQLVVLVQMLYYSIFMLAVALILLPIQELFSLYAYIVSALLVFTANSLSNHFVETEQSSISEMAFFNDVDCFKRVGSHLAAQCTFAIIVTFLLGIGNRTRLSLLVYTVPLLARVAHTPVEELPRIHSAAATFMLLLSVLFLINQLPVALEFGKASVQKLSVSIQMYGWIPFLIAMWFRLLLPLQFFIFWLILYAVQLCRYMAAVSHPVWKDGWPMAMLAAASECCTTPISFVGLCVVVSYVSCGVLAMTRFYLQGRDGFHNANVMHRGLAEGITMFLLGIQTGIIELRPPERAFLLSIVLFIVVSSLIQSVVEIADPILLSLAASQSRSIPKHLRAILLCTFLWMFPLYMMHLICRFFDIDFWLLVVISTCILTSLQVIGSVVVYALLMYDAAREKPWDSLDDIIYYSRCIVRILEFVVAVVVVGYGIERSVLGNWNWLNSSILVVHCYFNVWQRLQEGWSSYLQRREAVKKLEALPLATKAQLHDHDDVCTICFQEMHDSARVTACRHFFHGVCLRKWLFIQDYCPICHEKILRSSGDSSDNLATGDTNDQQTEDPIVGLGQTEVMT